MNALGNVVAYNQVEHLCVEHIIDVEDHLGEQPVGGAIERGVDEVAPGVGLDRQRQEVSRFGMDEEVGRAGCTVSRRCHFSLFVPALVAVLIRSAWVLDAS